MPVSFWNDPDSSRLHEANFAVYPDLWRHGERIKITPRGSCVIYGRSDATLNRGGVRMGTARVYAVVEGLEEVLDSLVIDTSGAGADDGELLCSLVLAAGASLADVEPRLRAALRGGLSPPACAQPVHRDRRGAPHAQRQEVRGAGEEDPRRRRPGARAELRCVAQPGLIAPLPGPACPVRLRDDTPGARACPLRRVWQPSNGSVIQPDNRIDARRVF